MSSTRIAIVYYSATGTLHAMAQVLADAARSSGAEVRLRRAAELAPSEAIAKNPAWVEHSEATTHVEVATHHDLVWAHGVLLGTPARFGNVAGPLKQFLDTLGPPWVRGELADKAYAGFTSSQTAHGGQESTLLALYNSVYHFGGVLVPPGYTAPLKFVDGNPYGVSHVTGTSDPHPLEATQTEALTHLAERVIDIAQRLRRG